MEKRFLRFPTVKRTALSAETYVSHMKNVRFRCRKRRTSKRNRRKPYIGFLNFDAEYILCKISIIYRNKFSKFILQLLILQLIC